MTKTAPDHISYHFNSPSEYSGWLNNSDEQEKVRGQVTYNFSPAHVEDDNLIQEVMDETESLMRTTVAEVAKHSTNDEKYAAIRRSVDERQLQTYQLASIAYTSDAYIHAFDAWKQLYDQTDSYYTKRLLERAMNREVHEVVPFTALTIDQAASDPEAYADWQEFDFYGVPPRGVVQRINFDALSEMFGPEYIEEHEEFFRYADDTAQRNPEFGDWDSNPPDPYRDMASAHDLSGIHQDDLELALETAHLFGVETGQLSEAVRANLYHFGVNLDEATYERVTAVVGSLDRENRRTFAEAFLATEFGDDLGDILLDLAESTDPDELRPVLKNIAEVRQASARLAESFRSDEALDNVLAERLPTAFIKRTTELLALARQDGVTEVDTSLATVASVAQMIAEGVKTDTLTLAGSESDFGTLRAQETPLTITARPHGHNARLGFTVRGLGDDGKQRLNIRLDYEDGYLSLDIGSTAKTGVNSSEIARKVGADLARGELALATLRAERSIAAGVHNQEITLHGNHVREAFADMPQLEPAEFAGIVNRFVYRLWYRDRLNDPNTPETAA